MTLRNMSAHLLVLSFESGPVLTCEWGFFLLYSNQEGALINQGKIMRRDVVATIGGLILVALVVVGTFLYGNSQREKQESQGQNQEQQQAQKTEQQKQEEQKQAQQAEQAKKAQEQQQANEAKQKAAQQQAQQQSTANQSKPATVPQTGATQTTQMPAAGGEIVYILGSAVTIYVAYLYRRSRLSLNSAAKAQS